MSLLYIRMISWCASFPRVSGDEPPIDIDLSTPSRFSPRERG